ncbi:hypothetical protein [Pseudodesulfovibrio pelocollis]|uniref:hypothetical protein n=1 Tax=Pseudodesulfovibrio pelocollis TaxID=3051432 RepID=UPI00255AB2A6|nr:hypothetical protein [Pseudodesulfovibrio sp. SB368]
MADCMWAQMELSGQIKTLEAFDALVDGLENESPFDENHSLALLAAAANGKAYVFDDPEARYGAFEYTEAACQKHGIAFRRHSNGKYEYRPETNAFFPEEGEGGVLYSSGAIQDSGEAVVSRSELEAAQRDGLPLEKIIEQSLKCEGSGLPDALVIDPEVAALVEARVKVAVDAVVGVKVSENIPLDLDMDLLAAQKLLLLRLADESSSKDDSELLDGVIGMIDSLQDHLVDNLGYEEKQIFKKKGE